MKTIKSKFVYLVCSVIILFLSNPVFAGYCEEALKECWSTCAYMLTLAVWCGTGCNIAYLMCG